MIKHPELHIIDITARHEPWHFKKLMKQFYPEVDYQNEIIKANSAQIMSVLQTNPLIDMGGIQSSFLKLASYLSGGNYDPVLSILPSTRTNLDSKVLEDTIKHIRRIAGNITAKILYLSNPEFVPTIHAMMDELNGVIYNTLKNSFLRFKEELDITDICDKKSFHLEASYFQSSSCDFLIFKFLYHE